MEAARGRGRGRPRVSRNLLRGVGTTRLAGARWVGGTGAESAVSAATVPSDVNSGVSDADVSQVCCSERYSGWGRGDPLLGAELAQLRRRLHHWVCVLVLDRGCQRFAC